MLRGVLHISNQELVLLQTLAQENPDLFPTLLGSKIAGGINQAADKTLSPISLELSEEDAEVLLDILTPEVFTKNPQLQSLRATLQQFVSSLRS